MSYQQVSEKEPIKNDNEEKNDMNESVSQSNDTSKIVDLSTRDSELFGTKLAVKSINANCGPCDKDLSCWAKGVWWLSCCNAWFDYPDLQPTCYCCGHGSLGNMDGNISILCCPCALCVGMCGAGIVRGICLCQGDREIFCCPCDCVRCCCDLCCKK